MNVGSHQKCHLVKTMFVFSLLAIALVRVSGYKTYVVEVDCRSGNLTAELDGIGATSAAHLRATDHTSYSLSMDCRLQLSAPPGMRILVSVREIGFRTYANGVCKDYLKIDHKLMCASLYREDESLTYHFTGNTVQMLYHVSREGIDNRTFTGYPGFQVVATAYTIGGECSAKDDLLRCHNDLCVWSGLRCDAHNNCGDGSDEQNCGESVGGSSSTTVLIILGALILLLLLIMCVATLLCSKNERVRRFSTRIRTRTLSFVRRFSR